MTLFGFGSWQGSPLWVAAGEAMLDFLISGAAAGVAFMVLRRLIGRLPAAMRYAASCMAMAALVGLAAFHTWDHWPVATMPFFNATADVGIHETSIAPAGSEFVGTFSPAQALIAVVEEVSPGQNFEWTAWKPTIIGGLPALWLIGAPLTALFVGLGWTGAARLKRASSPMVDEALLGRFRRCQALLKVRNVTLAVCDRIAAPIVVGILRPAILLPPSLLTSLTCEQWEMILLHELAHVRRLDNLVNLLQRGVETVLFFHPAVWWVSRWMRLEREHCCDAVVLKHGTGPQAYAETLAVLALPGIAPQLATAAMANHELLTRMRHILGTEDLAMTISWKKLGLAAVVFAAVINVVAGTDWSAWAENEAAAQDAFLLVDGTHEEPLEPELEGVIAVAPVEIGSVPSSTQQRMSWSAEQMLGPPDVPAHADDGHAWAARNPDAGEEWVSVGFGKPIKAAAILIHESFNPGAITAVKIDRSSGVNAPSWEDAVWQSTGAPPAAGSKNVLAIPVKNPEKGPISIVRIEIDERRVLGWNEIDAVGLVDAETGETHWATTANASSSYASVLQDSDESKGPRLNLIAKSELANTKPAWSAAQATGAPDVPQHSDDPNAWASAEPDQRDEWLEVEFGDDHLAAAVVIHESFNPGAIDRVEFIGRDKRSVVESVYLTPTIKMGKHVCVVRPDDFTLIRAVRIYIDERRVPGRNAIDAVGLIGARSGEIHWATKATASSSLGDRGAAHASPRTVSIAQDATDWSPAQATGAPNVEKSGDDRRAWASATPDGQDEWLELTYDPPVPARTVVVFESFNPGAIRNITLSGQKVAFRSGAIIWADGVHETEVWTAPQNGETPRGRAAKVVQVPDDVEHWVSKVRLEIDSKRIPGWNEIDAVGLLNRETGQMHWATDARASSWFGEDSPTVLGGGVVRDVSDLVIQPKSASPSQTTPSNLIANWSAAQATGKPNVEKAGDNPLAWASATQDGQQEWLELTYDPPAEASSIVIYESFNPGAVAEVHIEEVDPDPSALPAGKDSFRTLWKGAPWGVQDRNGLGVNWFPVKTNISAIKRVRLLIDSPRVKGWNEIDAVGLLTLKGEMQWAVSAGASSEYGASQPATLGAAPTAEAYDTARTGTLNAIVTSEREQHLQPVQAVARLDKQLKAIDSAGVEGKQANALKAALDQARGTIVDSANPASRPADRVQLIELDVDGAISMNGSAISVQKMTDLLRRHAESTPQPSVRIAAAQACSFQVVKSVFEACKQAGIQRISLVRGEGSVEDSAAASALLGLGKLEVIPFSELTVNLNEAQPRYLRMKLNLLVDAAGKEAFLQEIKHAILKDSLLRLCGDKTVEELRGAAGHQLLKDGILMTIRSTLPEAQREVLKDVLFEELMIQ